MLTKQLTEKQLGDAVKAWLPSQGMMAAGDVSFTIHGADRPGDEATISASVNVEIASPEKKARKPRATKV